MGQDIASLGIRIDSTQAATAATDLQRLASAANDAESAAGENVSAWGKVGKEFEEVVKHTRAHVLSLAGANEGTRAFTGILAHLPGTLLFAVAAIGALTAAYIRGQGESTAYAKALATTGNAAGVTVGQLSEFADAIGKTVANTHTAAAALATLAQTGAIGGENLKEFATIAIEVEERLGQTVEQTAKAFSDLANDPLAATLQFGKALGYLTPALYDQIRAYKQQGDTVHAATLAQQAYADANKKAVEQVTPNLGILQRAWEAVKNAAAGAASAAASIGRKDTLQQQLDTLNADLSVRAFKSDPPETRQRRKELEQQREDVIKQIAAQKQAAAADAARTQAANNFTEALVVQSASLEAATTITKAYYDAQTQNVQRAYAIVAAGIQAQSDLLEAQRSATLIDDQQYFSTKLKLIQQAGKAQEAEIDKEIALSKAQAAQEAALQKAQLGQASDPAEIARLQSEQISSSTAAAQKIKDLEAQRKQIAIETSSKIALAALEEGNSVAALSRSYADLVVSSNQYLDSLQKQYQLTLQGQGAGNQARSLAAQQANLVQHFQDQLNSNTDNLRNGKITQDQFDLQNKIIENALHKSEQDFDTYYKALEQKQGDWVNGAKEAFHNYIDESKNVALSSETAFTNAFRSIEDSIVNFATTGKFSFKDLTNSILSDLVRMEAKILESQALSAILSAFGGFTLDQGLVNSGYSSIPAVTSLDLSGRASGGAVNGGTPYIVGEKGPELFVPGQTGSIVPNGQWGGGGGVNITSVNNFGPGSEVGALTAELNRRDAQLKADINNSIARGQWNVALRSART